jgi:enterochelin esterase family protein
MAHLTRCIVGVVIAMVMIPQLARGGAVATTQPVFASSRIAALAADMARGDSSAVEKFWREMQGNSPIIEPIADDPTCSWVTFVWRGDADTGRVALLGGPVIHDFSKWLERLDDSDVWYRTERMPNDARFIYSFQVNRPEEWPRVFAKAEAMYKQYLPRPDPLNPRKEYDGSVLEMPDAPPQPWLVRVAGMSPAASKLWVKIPGVARGAVQSHVIASKRLKQDRRLDVYTPIGYDDAVAAGAKPYRLLVLLEGSGDAELLDNLRSRSACRRL